jgi:beta-glucanase (GH16 family)
LQANIFYASIRIQARVFGNSGAVAGLFTYLNDSTESDIEILTRDPADKIRYTNQPSTNAQGHTIAAAGIDATLPDAVQWTDWTTQRLDWTPSMSAWYANDILVANNTYGIPNLPSYLVLNMVSSPLSSHFLFHVPIGVNIGPFAIVEQWRELERQYDRRWGRVSAYPVDRYGL